MVFVGLDWASTDHVRFKWNALNLLHFPNVAGPRTFAGVLSLHGAFPRGYAPRRQLTLRVEAQFY